MTLVEFEAVFHGLFRKSENTELVNGLLSGKNEPLYIPADRTTPAKIVYANGFLQSALHETAHWCHAGVQRRQMIDYGYWYVGDSRDQEQQNHFEKVELIPQAYELLLSQVCGVEFQVSLDNFNPNVVLNREHFTDQVQQMASQKLNEDMSPRLRLLLQHLAK